MMSVAATLDKNDIVARLAANALPDWNTGGPDSVRRLVPAAVLVPLVPRDGGFTVVLTRRNENLRDHAGQISFPGGRIEPNDPSPEAAALREAQEEVGLRPRHVEVIGRLGRYRTGTGFLVYPVVGIVDAVATFRAEPGEVAEVFEVPLDFFLDSNNHRPHVVDRDGRRHRYYAMPYRDYYIWGATAGILHGLYQILAGD